MPADDQETGARIAGLRARVAGRSIRELTTDRPDAGGMEGAIAREASPAVQSEGDHAGRYRSGLPLAAEGFGRRYHRNRPWAVRDLTLAFPPGSVTALVGPNGAGKSTLMRACLGFEQADEGRVTVFGADPVRDKRKAVNAIGYVPQSSSLYTGLTIDEHFVLAAAVRSSFDQGYAIAQVRAAGLTEERRVSDLSGGERSKVALALALGTRAPLLLLDEPLASLDPLSRREFLGLLLDDVRSRQATVVLSSHIVSDVEHACDRLVVLAGGGALLESSIDSALARFRTRPAHELRGVEVIGRFAGADGDIRGLVTTEDGGRPASIEEIVLGHLARARTPTTGLVD
jgi:ABC-2 type transport system ATP-binding protein